jgi:foldase protein PrsA
MLLVSAVAALAAPVTAPKSTAKPAAKAPAAAKLPKGVVAMVNKTPIYEKDVLDRMWREGGQSVTDRAVNQTIVLLEAQKRKIAVTPKQVQAEFDVQKQQFTSQAGRQPADWNKIVDRYGKANMLADMKIQLLARKIGEDEAKTTKLTPEEIKTAEDQVEKDAHQVHAKHILVGIGDQFDKRSEADAQKRMQEVQDKLKAGAKWDDLAKEYSDDMSNKDRGGDLGFFKRGQMVKAFEDAAFSMKKDEITPTPVKTTFGLHLIQVVEIKNDPVTPESKKAAVAKALETKKQQATSSGTWFNKIRGTYKIETKFPPVQ